MFASETHGIEFLSRAQSDVLTDCFRLELVHEPIVQGDVVLVDNITALAWKNNTHVNCWKMCDDGSRKNEPDPGVSQEHLVNTRIRSMDYGHEDRTASGHLRADLSVH
jgi:hypothetical protein